MEVKELTEKIEKLADELMKWKDEADKEIKAHGEVSKGVADSIKRIEGELTDLKVKVERNEMPGPAQTKLIKSPGQQFIESEQYKAMVARNAVECDPVEVKDIVSSRITDTVGGVPVLPTIIPQPIMPAQQELRIRDLIPTAGTTSNTIYFVRGTFVSAAAPVKESKGSLDYPRDVQEKPEAALVFEPDYEAIQTIAHWIPATRQILADSPALRGLIDNQLIYGVKLAEEWQILFGPDPAVAPNLHGICLQATLYNPALPTQLGVEEPTRIDHIRAAILQARLALYPVSGIVLNPFDWAAIELAKGTDGRYVWVSVPEGGVTRLWRVPVVESDSMPQDHFLAGAFRLGATIYDREQVSIRISEHHDKFFIENLVAILCEERLALVVTRPQAFIFGAFPGEES